MTKLEFLNMLEELIDAAYDTSPCGTNSDGDDRYMETFDFKSFRRALYRMKEEAQNEQD